MALKEVQVPGVGVVVLAKRRGTKHFKLSVSAEGKVRVSLPPWVPYGAALPFIKSHRHWIDAQLSKRQKIVFEDGQIIGKSHRLRLYDFQSRPRRTQITPTEIRLWTAGPSDIPDFQIKIKQACEKALASQAEELLTDRLEELSRACRLPYKSLKIKKLTSRWGSCSSENRITLSSFLIQLPWPLIDYVLLHELTHTKHQHHGPAFWKAMRLAQAEVDERRRQLKAFHPGVMPA